MASAKWQVYKSVTERSLAFGDVGAVHRRKRCQRPHRPLLMGETGVWASCASFAHVVSMPASTADDELMATNNDADDVDAKRKDVFGTRVQLCVTRIVDVAALSGCLVLSAAVNNPSEAELYTGPKRIVLLARCHASSCRLLATACEARHSARTALRRPVPWSPI